MSTNASAHTVAQDHRESARDSGPAESVLQAIHCLQGLGREAGRPLTRTEGEALGEIYRRYGGMLLGVAIRLLGTQADAEDVVHDVFCRLPWLLSQYRDGGFGGWLKQVTARTALMRIRRESRRRQEPMNDEVPDYVVECDAIDLGDADALRQALDSLSTTLRQVVILRIYLGFTHREIGELLDISANTSEVRLCRAIKRLRVLLLETAPRARSA
jgi:RNA polymerase sigma-70 factor (ECF subfamily)